MGAARRMPVQCKHGRVSDWGDFGQDGAEPEPCYYCRRRAGRDEMRDLVYRGIVKRARENAGLRAVLEPLGLFTFMDLVDAISDSIEDAYASGAPIAEVGRFDDCFCLAGDGELHLHNHPDVCPVHPVPEPTEAPR